ncbi:diacylglycerol kinase family lipid kinase [Aquibacillus koreensis]|uniref:Diacylglycerol kinase family lipid kinase n=2 Tax=Aquibacillus koreensis TaxID=279446 RepID=A0A9X4AJH3_9BACI|nr:diacylglycerol kinase family lipid kinase [Aquibacillus koreensis]
MYIFIINKRAGRGRAADIFDALKKHPLYKQEKCRNYITEYPGHAEKLAEQIASLYSEQISCFIVVGGDGTVHEVVNGLKNFRQIPITCIPAGSGNDFARGYGVHGEPIEIFRKVVNQRSEKKYWSGFYWTDGKQERLKRLFVNSISFGFDAEVTERANCSSYKRWLNKWRIGSLTYVIALLQVVFRFKPMTVEIELDGDKKRLENVLMVTIMNHPFYGGGMKIIPGAQIRPNLLPILVIQDLARWKIPLLFITVYFGKHVRFKEVKVLYATSFSIESGESMHVQADGQTGKCKSCRVKKDAEARVVYGTK